jgi:hypothetical protein
MFRKTETSRQLSLQTSVNQYLTGKAAAQYDSKDEWHNIFYNQVVCRIDENLFSTLFSTGKGSPNAPIRTLIGMMILKEGLGYSDQQLYENCKFNLLTRKALGLVNINDPVPVESTYYLLRRRISDYYKETSVDLFDKCFKEITKEQIIEFEISGQSIRMDSKLIGANIAFYSRYELIHGVLIKYYKHILKYNIHLLSKKDCAILEEFVKEKSAEIVYRSSKSQITERLKLIGEFIHTILDVVKDSRNKHYKILKKVFEEQYNIHDSNKIDIKPNSDVSAKSIQSAHETECDFRKKDNKKTKGYNHNITETCDSKNNVNLITNIQVERATHPDNKFIEPSIKNSQDILGDKIKNVHADGAYNSESNQTFVNSEDINFYLTGFQGHPARYDLTVQDDGLRVIDTITNDIIPVTITKKGNYRIKTEKGYRYFTDKQIESCFLRKQVEELPTEIKNKRNNVEASIFQLAYHLRKDKTKYRGYFKNKIWAILRSLWMNFVRITNNLTKYNQNAINIINNNIILSFFEYNLELLSFLTRLESHERKFATFYQSNKFYAILRGV